MADDKKFDAEGALASGVSEDQVLDYLSKTRPYDVQGAIKAGASKRQIIDHLSGAEAHKERSSFWSNYWDTASAPVKGAGLAVKGAMEAAKGPGAAFTSPEGQQTAKDLYGGFVEPQVKMFRNAWDEASHGLPGSAATSVVEGLAPGVGPTVAKAADQWSSGDRSGSLGTWAGLLTTALLPRILGKAAGATSRGLAPRMYESTLEFESRVPLETRPEIIDRGLGRDVTKAAGYKPEKGTPVSKSGLKDAEQRRAEIKPKQMAEIHRVTDEALKRISRTEMEEPLEHLKREFDDGAIPEGVAMMDKLIRDLRDRYKDSELTPDQAQRYKEVVGKFLGSKKFGDVELHGATMGREAVVSKIRQLIEKVAPVEQMNWAMHLDKELHTAIDAALKKNPKFMSNMSPYIVGLGVENLVGLAHQPQVYGHAVMAGLLVREAMRHPTVMSNLAIQLDRAGIAVPKTLSNVGRYGPMLSGPGTAGKDEMPDWEGGPPGSEQPSAGPPRQSVPKIFVNPFE